MGSSWVKRRAEHAVKNWNWYLTALIVSLAFSFYAFLPDTETKAQHGDFIAGFAAALAFVWLIASFRQQQQELRLQRKELSLQRKSIEDQTKVLAASVELDVLRATFEDIRMFEHSLAQVKSGPNSINEIYSALFQGITHWKVLLESTDPQTVFDEYMKWSPIVFSARGFIERYAAAIHRYELHHDPSAPPPISTEFYIIQREDDLMKIPLLGGYSGSAIGICKHVAMAEPGLKAIDLAGAIASIMATGTSIVKEEYVKDLIDYLEENSRPFPAIYEQFKLSPLAKDYSFGNSE